MHELDGHRVLLYFIEAIHRNAHGSKGLTYYSYSKHVLMKELNVP